MSTTIHSAQYQNPVNNSKKSKVKKALKYGAIATVATAATAVGIAYGAKTGKFDKLMKFAQDKNMLKSFVGKGAEALNKAGKYIHGKAEAVVSNIVTKRTGVYQYDKPMFKQLFQSFFKAK